MEWNWFYAASSKAASIHRHLKGPSSSSSSSLPPLPKKNDYSYISFPPTPSILSAISRGVVIATPTHPFCTSEQGARRMKPHAASVSCASQRAPVIFAVSYATVGAAALEIVLWVIGLTAAAPPNTRRTTDSAALQVNNGFIYYWALFLECNTCVCVCFANLKSLHVSIEAGLCSDVFVPHHDCNEEGNNWTQRCCSLSCVISAWGIAFFKNLSSFTSLSPSSLSSSSILCPLLSSPPFPLSLSDSSDVVALLGLVRPPLPARVGFGAGRLRSVPLLPRARAAGCPQVEQQNSPTSPAGGQCELQRWR